MKQTIEIRAVDLVRRIRDDQAGRLADKSVAEVMEFFNRAAKRARRRSGTAQAARKSTEAAYKSSPTTAHKRRRG